MQRAFAYGGRDQKQLVRFITTFAQDCGIAADPRPAITHHPQLEQLGESRRIRRVQEHKRVVPLERTLQNARLGTCLDHKLSKQATRFSVDQQLIKWSAQATKMVEPEKENMGYLYVSSAEVA